MDQSCGRWKRGAAGVGDKYKKTLLLQKMTRTSIPRRGTPRQGSVHFPMKQVVLLLARSTNAADRTSDEHANADCHQDRRQVIAQVGQVVQHIVHLREPHKQLRFLRMLKP